MSVVLQALCLECEMAIVDFDERDGEINIYPRPCAHTGQIDGHAAALIWNAWAAGDAEIGALPELQIVRLVVPVDARTRRPDTPSEGLRTLGNDAVRSATYASSASTPDLPSNVSSGFGRSQHVSRVEPSERDNTPRRIEEGRCVSPAIGIRWLMYDGSLEPVRCGASNRCDYCAMFAALESALVLRLDAQIRQPEVGLTTTTARPDFPIDLLRLAEKRLWAALRKGRRIGAVGRRRKDEPVYEAFPELQYVGFLEWTTGEGTHSGGHRRPHIHHLVKGIPSDHPLLEEILVDGPRGEQVKTTKLEQRVAELWEAITGDAYIVEVRPLRTAAGAIAYLALHHHKRSQSPPPGFRGRRLRPSKGYYELPVKDLRQLARKLAAQERVRMAVKSAIAIEIEGADAPDQYEADELLMRALCEGLRDLANNPVEHQMDLWPDSDHDAERHELERHELIKRMTAELEKIRAANPPELVQVRERQEVDPDTGVFQRVATAVLGPLEPRRKREVLARYDRDFAEAVAA